MANNKFNLSKNDEPKASKFNLSKEQGTSHSVNPTEKINSTTEKKSKKWLWLLLALLAIIVVILLVKNGSKTESNTTDENTPAPIEQPATTEQSSATDETPTTNETATPANEEAVAPVASEQPTATPVAEPMQQPTAKPNASTKPVFAQPQGILDEKVKDVIRGKYGNGADRKQALGSEYNEIQKKVNEMYRNGEVY